MLKTCKEELDQLEKKFYEENKKSTFFKNKQKEECAKMICSNYPIEELMTNTIYQIKNTNKIFIDYTIFKLYINSENYETFIYYVFDTFRKTLLIYPTYEVHINLDTFTVSAAERYKNIIKLYCDESAKNGTTFIDKLIYMKLYHLPSIIDMIAKIMKPIINPDAYKKMILVSKQDSEIELKTLLS